MDRKIIVVLVFFALLIKATSQENVTTLGVQFKPMITSKFFGTTAESVQNGDLNLDFNPKFGINFGMIIRKGLTKNWSFETGINLVQRNYSIQFNHPILDEPAKLNFRFIGYEIPLQGMIYVRLGKNLFMNASGGFSFDMYPTNVESQTDARRDTLRFDFFQTTYRNRWVQFSVLANYGFEYRSKESGYFYLGATFHRPFSDIALTAARFELNSYPTRVEFPISGSYLTVDLRYFFAEDPERKKAKNKKTPK
jgi:hypothetical protein